MKIVRLAFILLFFFFAPILYAYDGITFYGAEITAKDRVNSEGQPLTTVKDILRQNRANYYVYGVRGKYDQPDDYFSSKSHRAIFETAKIYVEPTLAQKILYSRNPVFISVFVYSPTEIHIEAGLPRPDVD